jgi:hypothetical protein
MGALLFPLRKYAATKYYQAQTDIGAHNLALHFDLQKMALLGKWAVFHSKSAFTVEDG